MKNNKSTMFPFILIHTIYIAIGSVNAPNTLPI